MSKWTVALALGVGMVMFGAGAAQAQKHAVRRHKGVKMKCSAFTKTCTFKNNRARKMRCTYSVSFKIKKHHRGGKFRTKSGVVHVRRNGFTSQKFYFGHRRIKRITGASLTCHKKRRHHRRH